jgi:phospholipid/cholesterol/gamma-HCH transport system substrate-binding protein
LASIKTQFSVGLFVIVGFAVVAAAVIWLGLSHYLEKGHYYCAYFDESVQGLDADSAVKYRGVNIGRVSRLGVAPDGRLIEAVLKIEADVEPGKDWVAQLKSVGITGLMFVEIDRGTEQELSMSPKIDFPTKYPVIPTTPSGIKQFMDDVSELLDRLQGIDFVGIADRTKGAIDRFNQALDEARIEDLSKELRAAFRSANALISDPRWQRVMAAGEDAGNALTELSRSADGAVSEATRSVASVDRNFEAMKTDFGQALSDFRAAVAKADRFFEEGTGLAEDGKQRLAATERQLAATLRQLRLSSEQLNRLLEEISQQPSRLLFGEPPPPRPIEIEPDGR